MDESLICMLNTIKKVYLILLVVYSANLTAQNSYTLKSLSKEDGLSSITVYSIVEDKNGFIWIGADGGLNQFNGQKVIKYLHKPNDPTSISSNIIEQLFIDSKDRFWIGTFDKLHLYDYKKDEFIDVTSAQDSIITGILRHVHTFAEDDKGCLWLGTRNGLFKLCMDSLNAIKVTDETHLIKRSKIDNYNYVRKLIIDKHNRLWVGIKYGDKGVVKINLTDSSRTFYSHEPQNIKTLSNNEVRYMAFQSDDMLYVETVNGLNRYNEEEDNFTLVKPSIQFNYSQLIMSVRSGLNDNISTIFGSKYTIIDEISPELQSNILDDVTSQFITDINKKEILTGFKDSKGNIWYGSRYNGVYYLCKNNFGFYTYSSNSPVELNQMVRSVSLDEKNNTIWFSAFDEIYKLDRRKDVLKVYSLKSGNNPLGLKNDEVIKATLLSSQKDLVIGTNYGVIVYDTKLEKVKRKFPYVNNDFKNRETVPSNQLQLFFEASNGIIYIGYFGKGVSSYDPNTEKLTHYNNSYPELFNSSVFSMLESDSNYIWIGTSYGIVKINFDKQKAEKFLFDPMNLIKTIAEDKKGRIWAGGNGLLYYDSVIKHFKYDTVIGAKFNIGNILPYKNALWISTQSGLIRYIPDSASYILYSREHGIISEDMFSSINRVSNEGEIILGSDKGLTLFYPDKVKTKVSFPKIMLRKCLINNLVMDIDQEINGQVVLTKSITNTRQLNLNHKNNSFSFEFSSIEYLTPKKIRYKYKLDGFDNIWINVEEGSNKLVYTNIPPGKYMLQIISTNNLGQWNNTPFELEINIANPIWRTWGFIVSVVLAILFLIYIIFQWRTKFLRNNQISLKRMVEERTEELEENQIEIIAQKQELESQRDSLNDLNLQLENQNKEINLHRNHLEEQIEKRTKELIEAKVKAEESDKLKSMFLANMSHEIRTPMNAILGFSSLLSSNDLGDYEREMSIRHINNNGESLLRLIEDIIDISQIQTHQLKIKNHSFVIDELLEELYLEFQSLASETKIGLELKESNLKTPIIGDRVRIKQVISNLLSNAFKYSERGTVSFGYTRQNDNMLKFFIQDTGVGIKPDIIEDIFNVFIKDERSVEKKYRGAGLGLAICKNLVELMNGKIWVDSQVGKGSSFYFTLDYNRNSDLVIETSAENRISSAEVAIKLKGKKLLIVEDEVTNMELLLFYLKDTGMIIKEATNGQEAVDQVYSNSGEIDMILMDIKMPVMDGVEALVEIRKKYKDIPVIAQTAFTQEKEKTELYNAGFKEIITKPIARRILMTKLLSHI